MKENAPAKIIDIADFIQKYVIPAIVSIFVAGVIWATVSGDIKQQASDMINLSNRVEAYENREDTEKILLEKRLSSIETKLDFIIKILDKAN